MLGRKPISGGSPSQHVVVDLTEEAAAFRSSVKSGSRAQQPQRLKQPQCLQCLKEKSGLVFELVFLLYFYYIVLYLYLYLYLYCIVLHCIVLYCVVL